MKLSWSPRSQPLEIEACWAEGASLSRLRSKLSQRSELRQFPTVSGLVVVGDDLPWVEGLVYLGCQQSLYLPTRWQPNLPLEWLIARLREHSPAPWVLLPPGRAIGLNPP